MNWEYYFSSMIRSRGKQYQKAGRVKEIEVKENEITARVSGTRSYQVKITLLGAQRMMLSCSCPYALDGHNCKHMAAVLYEYESLVQKGKAGLPVKKEEERIPGTKLFPATEQRKNSFYDMNRIASDVRFLKRDVQEAEKLVREKQLVLINMKEQFAGNYQGAYRVAEATAVPANEDSRGYYVRIRFKKTKIDALSCNMCKDQRNGYSYDPIIKTCPHTAALLFLLDDYIKKFDPGDETDYTGSLFLRSGSRAAGRARLQTGEKKEVIRLEPKITKDYDGYRVSFRVGKEKLYVLKNLEEFVDRFASADKMILGKYQTLDFSEETFTSDALAYFRMIRQTVLQNRSYQEQNDYYGYYYAKPAIESDLLLSGQMMDQFYEAAKGRTLPFKDKYEETDITSLHIGEKNLRMKLTIRPKKNRNRFAGARIVGRIPQMIEGLDGSYFATDKGIGKLSEEDAKVLEPLFAVSVDGRCEFTIGKKNLQEFYYRSLPALKNSGLVEVEEEEADLLAANLPPEAVFLFFLDMEDGDPVCRARVQYDEITVALASFLENGQEGNAFRDMTEELRVNEEVLSYFPRYDTEKAEYHCPADTEDLIERMDEAVSALAAIGEVRATDAFDRLKIKKMPQVKIGVSIESSLLDLDISSSELTREELAELLASYRKKKNYHRLKDGRFISTKEDETLAALSEMMDTLQISEKDFIKGKQHLPLFRALYLDRMLEDHEELQTARDRRFRSLIREFRSVENTDREVPEGLTDVLRNYQIYGYRWISMLAKAGFGGILADEMGLGKTLQVITVLRSEQETGEGGLALVVCPASVVFNWLEEIKRFAPELSAVTVTGPKEEREEIIKAAKGTQVLITSYDLLKRDIALYEDKRFSFEVIDEAQFIKNPKTAAARAVKVIRAEHKFALTGTPIENRLSELWSIFDYLMPGFLYGYERFRSRFETPIVKMKDENTTERLRKMTSPFILRRLKTDVLKDLPEKTEEIRYSVFESEQRHFYDAQVLHMKEMLEGEESLDGSRIKVLAELTKIRQICCDPSLLAENYKGTSAKREACVELVQSAIDGGHKVLIFSQFVSMLKLLEESFDKAGIAWYEIIGATKKEERLELVHKFNEDDTPVFLISLKAGGTGLNLTGADIVIHYDPWWNFAAQNQATDRAHRIGQTRTVSVYKLIAKDTIEEKIVKLQDEKKDLADAILSGENTSLATMSKEELYELLG